MLKKSSPILFLVSNCNTLSKRELYVEELAKYINITQFGKCTNEFCDANCEDEQISKPEFCITHFNQWHSQTMDWHFFGAKIAILTIFSEKMVIFFKIGKTSGDP
jgi:hypothetical protein